MHCHTKMSDGTLSIDELVMLAARRGIATIAVTDHDTFAGAKRAKVFGDRHGVEVIPGAEFSCTDNKTKRKVHILCYYCDSTDRLEGLCRRTGDARRKAMLISLQKVLRIYPVTADMVMHRAQGSTNLYKQHIMHALIDAGCTDEFYGSVFKKLFDARCGLAYTPIEYPDVHEVIQQIHDAGGIAVLAHPGVYDSFELLEQLAADREIEGVEVWHPRNKEGEAERLIEIAEENALIMTGGTDFHGMYNNGMYPLGTCTTPKEQLTLLKKCKRKLNL